MIGACRDETKLFLLDRDHVAVTSERDRQRAPVHDSPLASTGRDDFVHWLGPDAERIVSAYARSRPGATFLELEAAIRGDRQFLIPSVRFAEAQMASRTSPVFFYSFDWVSPLLPQLGAFHSNDIPFFFSNTQRMALNRDPSSFELATKMSDALIAFARSGDPSHPTLPRWDPYDPQRRATMIFDGTCRVDEDPRADERHAWEEVSLDYIGF
jgi:para-nitrobenzyl esterase